MQNLRLIDKSAILVILFAACIIVSPIIFWGIPDNYDLMQHVRFAGTYLQAIEHGTAIPSWGAGDNFGFGSVGVRFYPPVAYLVLAITRLGVGSWYDAFWVTALFWTALGSTGVYLWSREWMDQGWSLFAALLYMIAPYHTFQLFQAVLYSEYAVAGLLPFCFLFLTRLCRHGRNIDLLLFSISLALVMLTHIPSTLIALACLTLYAVAMLERGNALVTTFRVALAYALAFLASIFHWIKAITELNWVAHNNPQYFSNGYYDFHRYLFPLYLVNPATRYVERLMWELDLIIILTLAFLLPVMTISLRSWRPLRETLFFSRKDREERKGPLSPLLVVGVFSLLMLSVASTPLWEYLPVLPKIQFPWRWLIVTTVIGPVIFALAVSPFAKNRVAIYGALAFALLTFLYSTTQNIIQSSPLPREVFDKQVAEMDNEQACECWWPVWSKKEALERRERVEAGERQYEIERWDDTKRTFSVAAGAAGNVRVASFWYPYWHAEINGMPVAVEKDNNGAILIAVPAEAANIRLHFDEPWFVTAAKYLSLVTWLSLVAGVVFLLWKRMQVSNG